MHVMSVGITNLGMIMMTDVIDRKAAIDALMPIYKSASLRNRNVFSTARKCMSAIEELPSAQPERLTDDDFETIRIHLNAYKEKLCNQQRWEEADEYQRILDRFMSFASAQPEQLTDKEQRIFLAAMGREEKVCKQVDDECRNCREPYEDSLVRTCHEITRKVKGALWMT